MFVCACVCVCVCVCVNRSVISATSATLFLYLVLLSRVHLPTPPSPLCITVYQDGQRFVGRGATLAVPKLQSSTKHLASGAMGKLLIRKSGQIDLKLGDTIFQVTEGMGFTSCEEVAVVSKGSEEYCILGSLEHRLMISPNVEALLRQAHDHR